jgi:hypothetical protein
LAKVQLLIHWDWTFMTEICIRNSISHDIIDASIANRNSLQSRFSKG